MALFILWSAMLPEQATAQIACSGAVVVASGGGFVDNDVKAVCGNPTGGVNQVVTGTAAGSVVNGWEFAYNSGQTVSRPATSTFTVTGTPGLFTISLGDGTVINNGTASGTAVEGSQGTMNFRVGVTTLTNLQVRLLGVTSISPGSGAAGDTITINGSFVSGNTYSVQFGSLTPVSVTASSNTQLSVTVPSSGSGTVTVSVTDSTLSKSAGSGSFTFAASASPPTISAAFSPTSIASGGSSTLTLTITNPNSGTALTGVAVAAAALPTGMTGSSPGTTCTSGTATYNGGTRSLSLSGATLAASASCTVTLSVTSTTPGTSNYTSGTVSATGPSTLNGTTATTATGLTVTGAALGFSVSFSPATLAVGTGAGATGTLTLSFTNANATASPSFNTSVHSNDVVLSRNPGLGGTCVSSGFSTSVPNTAQVNINSLEIPAGGCTITLPYRGLSVGTAIFTADGFTPAGYVATAGATSNTITVVPSITGISPNSGRTAGGTSVAIIGTGFSTTPANNTVAFGAAGNGTVTAATATSLTVTTPASSSGAVSVTVTVGGQTTVTGQTFTYVAGPTVTSISSVSGPTGGGQIVTITGSGFAAANTTGAVKFGAANATYTINSDTQITATSPANSAGTYDITVTTVGGTSTTNAGDQYTYVAAPTVTSISQTSGPTGGGTMVTITGTGFSFANATGAVKFGAANATYTIHSNTQITATAPANGAGTYDITVTTPGGTSATNAADQYTYVAVPTITSVSPAAGGTAGGTTVTVTGTNFIGVSAVTFGGNAASSFTFNSDTSITATSPAGSGIVDIRVTTPGGTSATSAADQFTYVTQVSLSPAAGALPGSAAQTAYSQTFTASGGTAPYSFSSVGAIPPGLTLSADGVLSGTPTAPGTYNFTVNVSDDSATLTGSAFTASQSYSVAIVQAGQTISFATLSNTSLSASPLTLTATASSGLTVAFSSTTTGVCTVTGNIVALLQTGTCTIDADQAGDATYTAAPTVSQSFTVTPANLTISNGTASGLVVGGSYSQANTAIGGAAPYSYSLAAGAFVPGTNLNASTGTVSGTPTIAGSFSYIVRVTDSQGTPVAADTSVTTITIAKGNQTASFTSMSPSAAVNGSYSLAATATSGLPVTFAIDPSSSAVCSLSGNMVTFTAPGTCTVDADQAGDTNWNAAPRVQQSVTVGQATQTIAFTSPVPSVAVGGSYTPIATASSGLPVILTIDPSSNVVCGLSGGTVSFTAVGTCTVNADQAGDANTTAAPRVQQSVTVGQATQTVAFTSTPPSSAIVGGAYNLTATASSGLPVAFTIDPSSSTVCGLSGSAVTFTAAGTCTIDADQAGSADHTAAPRVQQSVVVTQALQTITFTSTPPSPAAVGTTYNPAAIASSGLPVAFTIDPSSSEVCGLSGGTVTFTAAGSCTIDADQAGDTVHTAAPRVQQSVTVTQTAQAITFTSTPPVSPMMGATYSPTATASSGLPVIFAIAAGSSEQCSLTGGTVSFTGAGICTILADQAGDAAFAAALQAQQDVSVALPPPPVAISNDSVASVQAGSGASATIDLSQLISGEVTSIVIDQQPQHGTVLLLSGGSASRFAFLAAAVTMLETHAIYTPEPGYSGPDNFTFRAIGPGGLSNVGTVTIQVIAAVPTAAPLTVNTLAGKMLTVDLTAGAVGEPFTGGAIVSVTPADAADVRLVEGGMPQARTYSLQFTSRTNDTGEVTILYTLSNVGGTSAPLSLTVQVEARPDPSADPEVRGIEGAVTGAVRRTATTQIRNFGRRMEQLHDGARTKGFGVGLSSDLLGKIRYRTDDLDYSDPTQPEGVRRPGGMGMSTGNAAPTGTRASPAQIPQGSEDQEAAAESALRPRGNVELWANGTITVGSRDATKVTQRFELSTSGLSFGADMVVADGATIGLGGGFGRDRTDVGDNGSRVRAGSWVAGAYGSFRPVDGAFVDLLAGVGGSDFDLTRYVTATGTLATAKRQSDMQFGSVRAGIDRSGDVLRWSLFSGVETSHTKLGAYVEKGPESYSLAYDARRLTSITGLLGGRFEYSLSAGETVLTPRGRFEYRYDFETAQDQRVRFSDWLTGPSYLVNADGWSRHQVTMELGLGAAPPGGWRLGADVTGDLSGNARSVGARLEASRGF
ncbi:IPT/TIG domain-containing protein [Sphingobium sp. LB126]|uniref:IPT/TIG domain-containing protein n=1 Tax=Sphingobium sp. LB126 TaxID=1983755 RepID=UPI0012FDD38A|nr:IPT/TIG domain-containing protein [Sphingobium sp. LB126]